MRRTRIPRLFGLMYYLKNYLAYKRLTSSRIRVELASPTNLGLRIISRITSPINILRAPVYACNSHPLPTWG